MVFKKLNNKYNFFFLIELGVECRQLRYFKISLLFIGQINILVYSIL